MFPTFILSRMSRHDGACLSLITQTRSRQGSLKWESAPVEMVCQTHCECNHVGRHTLYRIRVSNFLNLEERWFKSVDILQKNDSVIIQRRFFARYYLIPPTLFAANVLPTPRRKGPGFRSPLSPWRISIASVCRWRAVLRGMFLFSGQAHLKMILNPQKDISNWNVFSGSPGA